MKDDPAPSILGFHKPSMLGKNMEICEHHVMVGFKTRFWAAAKCKCRVPILGIQSPKLRMVMEPKHYVEEVIGHPLLIIWEYDERCLGPTNWSGDFYSCQVWWCFCPLKEDTIRPGKMWKCHKVSTIRRCGFTCFLSKLEVDALEKGRTCILWHSLPDRIKNNPFFGGWEPSELIPLRW